eukprot:6105647-Pleurochrysis_carterae.AAC.1
MLPGINNDASMPCVLPPRAQHTPLRARTAAHVFSTPNPPTHSLQHTHDPYDGCNRPVNRPSCATVWSNRTWREYEGAWATKRKTKEQLGCARASSIAPCRSYIQHLMRLVEEEGLGVAAAINWRGLGGLSLTAASGWPRPYCALCQNDVAQARARALRSRLAAS